jgi:type II secretory ATPase GspE/PulE/Tfp pilus assembly ATPase PilB-like protein
MEVAPFVASSALIGVVAQRLVRRLCPACKEPVRLTKTMLTERGFAFDELKVRTIYSKHDGGCDECHGTGYRGRIGAFEIMPMDDELERLFLAEAPSEVLRTAALNAGMKTLRADALDKVAAGTTSLDEVARVVL